MNRSLGVFIALAVVSAMAHADSIVIDGKTLDGAYIIESPHAYYICQSADGMTQSIAKSDPTLGAVLISSDPAARNALYAEFKARKITREREALNLSSPAPEEIVLAFDMGSRAPATSKAALEKSKTPVLRLKGEPRAAPPDIQDIIDRNLGIAETRQAPAGGGYAGGGGGAGNPGGMGGQASGFTGGGGAVAGSGGLGAGGGAGGAGGGGTGGSGAGGGQSGSFGFRNISELFTTVDDAAVGETPNPITGR